MPRLAALLVAFAVLAALLAGCGSSSIETDGKQVGTLTDEVQVEPSGGKDNNPGAPVGATAKSCETGAVGAEGLSVTGVSCQQGQQVIYDWQRASSCAPLAGASRSGCAAGSYRCTSVLSERGLAVSCSRPGHSIAFIAQRR